MLQTVMQQNLLFYGIGILSFFGVISQIWLWMIYGRMTKDMENERAAKGKLIRQIRQRYGLLKRMGDGNVNTRALLRGAFISTGIWGERSISGGGPGL